MSQASSKDHLGQSPESPVSIMSSAQTGLLINVRRNRHIVTSIESRILLALIAGCVISQPSCSRLPTPSADHVPVAASHRLLSADEAAVLAARLANDQCEHLYRKRSFRAEQHSAVFQGGMYHWGGLDIGAPGGLSALVTFHQDGSEPHVEVYFSDAM